MQSQRKYAYIKGTARRYCFAVVIVVATSFASATQSYSADGFEGARFVPLKLLRRHPFEGFSNAFGIVLASKVENNNEK